MASNVITRKTAVIVALGVCLVVTVGNIITIVTSASSRTLHLITPSHIPPAGPLAQSEQPVGHLDLVHAFRNSWWPHNRRSANQNENGLPSSTLNSVSKVNNIKNHDSHPVLGDANDIEKSINLEKPFVLENIASAHNNPASVASVEGLAEDKQVVLENVSKSLVHDQSSHTLKSKHPKSNMEYKPKQKLHDSGGGVGLVNVDKLNRKDGFIHWKTNNEEVVDVIKAPQTQRHRGGKYLLYSCGLQDTCGGLADRLKGMVLGYVLANITGRTFGISMPLPGCQLSDMLQENKVEWRVNVSGWTEMGKSPISKNYIRMNARYRLGAELKSLDYRLYFGDVDVVYFRTNLERLGDLWSNPHHGPQLHWHQPLRLSLLYRRLLQALFRLAPPLQAQVDNLVAKARTARAGHAESARGSHVHSVPPSHMESALAGLVKSALNIHEKSGNKIHKASRKGKNVKSFKGILMECAEGIDSTQVISVKSAERPQNLRLVCAQIRAGRNPSIPHDTAVRITSKHLPVIWNFMKAYSSSPVSFFVSTDSEEVLEKARTALGPALLEVGKGYCARGQTREGE